MKFKQFDKDKRGTFQYWFWHWFAYNYIAIKYHVWQFKYLFHDIEKPWMKLFLVNLLKIKTYQEVKQWHREHNNHHLSYKGKKELDYQAMIIDWECSRFTKKDPSRQNDAIKEINAKLDKGEITYVQYKILMSLAHNILIEQKY